MAHETLTGREALARRSALGLAVLGWFPSFLRPRIAPFADAFLTYVSGIATSGIATTPAPLKPGSESRLFATTALALILGAASIFGLLPGVGLHGLFVAMGAARLLYGMRSLTSVIGPHLTDCPIAYHWIYDAVSAMLLLPSLATASGGTQGMEALRVRSFAAVLDPVFHYRFLKARLTSVLLRGPLWRRMLGLVTLALLGYTAASPVPVIVWLLLVWLLVTVPLYQAATLLQWSTGHFGSGAQFGRLLLADPNSRYLPRTLAGHALFRILLLSGDLVNRDLRGRIGERAWVDAAFVRTALILEGKSALHQTGSIRDMFALSFEVNAAEAGIAPLAPRHMDPEGMLRM